MPAPSKVRASSASMEVGRCVWADRVDEASDEAYHRAGYSGGRGPGLSPAVVVVDMTVQFLGDGPKSLEESQSKYPYSCGRVGWDVLERINGLASTARGIGVPVFFTRGRWNKLELGQMTAHNTRAADLPKNTSEAAFLDGLQPMDDDVVIEKRRPSAFFGTPLLSYLMSARVDTIVLTGNTTSGCIRATAVDAYSHGFDVCVIEDCVFDRTEPSHLLSLFDLHHKYATVMSLQQISRYLTDLPVASAS